MALRDKLDSSRLEMVSLNLPYGDNPPYVTVDINTQKVTSLRSNLPSGIKNDGTRLNSAIIDTARIGTFLFEKPWWSTNQVGLQLMNVKPNFGFRNGRGGVTQTPSALQLYNPANTLAQVALTGIGAHIDRFGLLPGVGNAYIDLKKNETKDNDPLIIFREKLLSSNNRDSNILYSYLSGPNSAYGVGSTSARLDITTLTLTKDAKNKVSGSIQYSGETSGSGIYYENASYNSSDPYATISPITIYNGAPSPITYTNGYGDKVTISGSFKTQNRENRVGSGRQDLINLTPLFTHPSSSIGDNIRINNVAYNINDLVKFRIQALDNDNINNNTWMIFRAYLTNFDDSVTANWNEFKYSGRGEDFFTYQGFSRTMNIGFKVAALSAVEMKPMYDKLNYLMSCLMPDYSDGGTMRGNIVNMTVGNYLDGQPGILTQLSYKIPNDSPWEIGLADIPESQQYNTIEEKYQFTKRQDIYPIKGTLDKDWKNNYPFKDDADKLSSKLLVLPHIIEVTMTFKPIGVRTQGNIKIPQKIKSGNWSTNIAQNENGAIYTESNYMVNNINAGTITQ
jgi:hypothetical protein